MNRRQAKARLAELAVILTVRQTAKDNAMSIGSQIAFDKACVQYDAADAEIWELQRFIQTGRRVDSDTAALISANID